MDYYPPMSNLRTSITHPLQIAELNAPGGGLVGITFCPGKCQQFAATGAWQRDLGLDLRAISDWGAGVLVTLVTSAELTELRVEGLGRAAEEAGLTWLHLPITDVSTPTPEWERAWASERGIVHAELDRGGRVVVHCKGGLGRAGTIVARILVERGMAPPDAIAVVRSARPGAIETSGQERYVQALASLEGPAAAVEATNGSTGA